jgi:putative transposase
MTEKVRQRHKTLFPQIGEDFGFEIEALEVVADHVHIFLLFPPKFSISKTVGILKSISTSVLLEEDDGLRKRLWSGKFWGDGYFARTVGDQVTAAVIKRYIRHQQKPDSDLRLF